MAELRIAVMGAAGRMGRELVRAVMSEPHATLIGGSECHGSPAIGQDIGFVAGVGEVGCLITGDPLELMTRADAIIDFTSPKATLEFAGLAANARIVHVIGTTGLSLEDEAAINAAARHAVIVKSGNMSLGVNLIAEVTRRVAKALDADYDIEIVEMHHRHKVDAPSGTALLLGRAAADGRGIDLDHHSVRGRDGHTGARKRGEIGFATLRGGSVVGDHSVIFAGEGEQITLSHHAADRAIFSRGAVKAAIWGHGKKPGLYSMIDVLGL